MIGMLPDVICVCNGLVCFPRCVSEYERNYKLTCFFCASDLFCTDAKILADLKKKMFCCPLGIAIS